MLVNGHPKTSPHPEPGVLTVLLLFPAIQSTLTLAIGIGIIYPLVNVYRTMENHHVFNGKTHYFDWFMLCNESPEGGENHGPLASGPDSGNTRWLLISPSFWTPKIWCLKIRSLIRSRWKKTNHPSSKESNSRETRSEKETHRNLFGNLACGTCWTFPKPEETSRILIE